MSNASPGTNNESGKVLYRREYSGGAWGSWAVVLNDAIIRAAPGIQSALIANTSQISHHSGNINAEGHIYAMVTATQASDSTNPMYFFKSINYGATWTATHTALYPQSGEQRIPMCLAVGMLLGTSGYGAGQVIYCGYRNRSIGQYPTICYTNDQGATFVDIAGGTNMNPQGTRIQVDPNDQSIFYTIFAQIQDQAGALWKHTNYSGSEAAMPAFGNVTRPGLCKVGLASTMHAAATTVLKVSTNSGTTVTNISVTGNIAGGGVPLNWNWNHLMSIHSMVNGTAVTRAIQLSPDGGVTWYNKHGNINANCNGLVNVGFSLDN